ncbi:hypothetical protein BGZ98_008995 [Dissophora globulifera]|nr:hypothetical protein BGZ98_008995 [Dissophora globulifera]
MDADAWRPLPSSSSSELLSQQATTTTSSAQYRARSAPRARPSNLARSSFSHNQGRRCHHHRNRPSKQFVATTSGDIFGDWDIELKIDHRTLAKTTGTAAATRGVNVESKATSAAGRRGGGGGSGIERGSITVGAGPGVNTGSSGMAPPSIPLATAPISSSSSTTATTASPVLRIMKGELSSTPASIPSASKASPSTKTLKNNTSTTTQTAATMTATATPSTNINYNSSSSPPWKKNASKKSSDNNKNAVTSAPTTTIATIPSTSTSVVSAAAAAAAKKSWNKKDGDEILDSAVPAPSARSSFLKALGKFKTKHLHQKR